MTRTDTRTPLRVRVSTGKGMGTIKSTHGLPMWITSENCWERCLFSGFPIHALAQRDEMFVITVWTICWLQNSLKKNFKVLFEPGIKIWILEPIYFSNSYFKTFIQPKWSLNIVVGAPSFTRSLELWLKLFTNKQMTISVFGLPAMWQCTSICQPWICQPWICGAYGFDLP